ncbi:RagB/SusD family nutrient uptake outer membrane protein [uncultured Spirosoma sp.]|uniref:RagB/SusD family nutrient uptake outer membrane protein n=1 Tax=uncultured Spirosoma sp. TaxID=278208 RepID=UPI00258C5074|nr:RagB/SusD family nutrient uptake outer membrane protein [uncultured Spirosoma sp.]
MKKLLTYVGVWGTMFLLGCQTDILDQLPKDSLSDATVWSDAQASTQFVNGIYGAMPSGFDRNYQGWAKGLYLLDAASDDGDLCFPWTTVNVLQNGDFLPSSSPLPEMWTDYYALVRRSNVALANLDRISNETLRNRLKGEVYYLRGYIYHELLRLYGLRSSSSAEPTGVPLIDKPLSPSEDLQIGRATYDQVVAFIISDLDKAASLLPVKGQIEAGRATKGAAYALKSRVLLYSQKWSDAATAAKQVIGSGYSLFSDYRTLFLTKNNDEVIYAKKFQDPDKVHFGLNNGWDVINSPRSFKGASDAGWGGNVPTQNFVDSYELTDGKKQSESSLYNPAKPFDNLDARFYATVVYNGSTFRGHVMEMYPGGADVTNQPEDTQTGYQLRKFHMEQYPVYTKSSDQDWIYIRYAEVLLNYAEAQNEASGPDNTVYDAINAIRKRANLPNLPTGLSKDAMRERIRNERRVELAFEEHRFFDIRRWGIAQSVLDGPLYGLKYTKTASGITYTRYPFETRRFPSKLMVFPIPQSEVDKNPAAKQIAGW